MRRLIVNADDFGLTAGINRAILDLQRQGVLTSATLMAAPQAFANAAEAARNTPSLGVGCHVVLVDGEPLLASDQVPSLLEGGTFRSSLSAFVTALYRGRIQESEIEAEALAQIRELQAAGIRVTHVDTHKHTHMFPRVLRPLIRAAMQAGVRAIRNPFEPGWSVRATAGGGSLRRLQVRLLRSQSSFFAESVRQSGLLTTDGALGVLATGTLDAPTLKGILAAMPAEGTWELVCHPGYNDSDLSRVRTRLRTAREVERTALSEALAGWVNADAGNRLLHFGQLTVPSAEAAG